MSTGNPVSFTCESAQKSIRPCVRHGVGRVPPLMQTFPRKLTLTMVLDILSNRLIYNTHGGTVGTRTQDQALKVFKSIAAAPKALAALLTGYKHTGARPSELANATVADFDASGGTVVLRSRKGRGSKIRARAVTLSIEGIQFCNAQARSKLPGAPLMRFLIDANLPRAISP